MSHDKNIIFSNEDIKFMNLALDEARKAFDLDETPIGAIITHNNKIIAKAYNRRNTDKKSIAHAEIIAITKACEEIGDWRLEECTIYITLEPCPMCAGAIVQSRIPRVVFGASSPKSGFGGSQFNLLQMESLNHRCDVLKGVCESECTDLLKKYFKAMREKTLTCN